MLEALNLAHVILICSHADLDTQGVFGSIESNISSIVTESECQMKLAGTIAIDCRESGSSKMDNLVTLLAQSTETLRQRGATSFKAQCLYVFITEHIKGVSWVCVLLVQ